MKKYIKKISLLVFLCMSVCSGCAKKDAGTGTGAGTETDIETDADTRTDTGTKTDAEASFAAEGTGRAVTAGDMADRNNTDVVLVMDESGSMVKADPQRLAIEGAKLFVDMEKMSGVSVGLIEFSNELRSTGLIEMQQRQNKDYLKTILDEIQYGARAHTDTGAAMLEAVSVLEQSKSGNDKAIVLFTDGRTDIDAGTPGRTTKDSQDDTKAAVKLAAEKGYAIYCIGLNSDGSVDKKELKRMTSQTGGQYHIASSVDEIRDFFNSIFVDIDDTEEVKIDEYTADGKYHASRFTVSSSSAAEANIVILSSRQVKDIKLTDSSGSPVSLKKDKNVYFSVSSAYSMIKLIRPKPGDWEIRVKGVKNDQIKIGIIYNFDLSLIAEADRTMVQSGQGVNIKAYLASDGKPFADKDFYEKLSGFFTAEGSDGQVIKEPLALNENKDALTGVFTPSKAADYEVSIHVEGNSLFRDSSSFTVTAAEAESAPARKKETKTPARQESKKGFPLIPAAAAAAAAVIAALLLIKKGRIRLDGCFKLSIDYAQMDENGVPQVQTFDVAGTIPARALGRQGFAADALLEAAGSLYLAVEYDEDKKAAFKKCISETAQEAKKVKFAGGRAPFELQVKRGGAQVKFFQMGVLSDRDTMTVSIGNAANAGMGIVSEKAFGLRFSCGGAAAAQEQKNQNYVQVNIVYRTM